MGFSHAWLVQSWTFVVLSVLFACQEKPAAQYRSSANNAFAAGGTGFPSELQLVTHDIESDAYDYTFATMGITFKDANGKDVVSGDLEAQRFAYFPSKQVPTASQLATLAELCRDLSLSAEAKSIKELDAVPEDGAMFLHWRSYHSVALKESLASLLLKEPVPILCLLRVTITENKKVATHYIAFDPIPDEKGNFNGTKNLAKATAEGLMLQSTQLIDDKKLVLKDSFLYEVEDAPSPILEVPALRNDRITVNAAETIGAGCRMHVTAAGTQIGNPKEIQRLAYAVQTPQDVLVQKAIPLSTSGVSSPLCADPQLKMEDKSLKIDIACEDYFKLQESDGKEASCRWQVEWANQSDPSNTVSVVIDMNRIKVETIDVRTIPGAVKALPFAVNNVVREKTSQLVGFSDIQLSVLEKGFDYWIAVSPAAFKAVYEGFVKSINYVGVKTEPCQGNAAAYVTFEGSKAIPEINWCEGGYMGASAITAQAAPPRVPLVAQTLFHEALHTRGLGHDFEEPSYLPCTGSAASAQLLYDTVVTCKADYCVPFRDAARFYYIDELDYSLEGDPRRFQGQCQIWNAGLGLTPARFAP